MLNYIWAGLIISAFVFALGNDIGDLGPTATERAAAPGYADVYRGL